MLYGPLWIPLSLLDHLLYESKLFVALLQQILIGDPPVVHDADASVEVRRKGEPRDVGHEAPAGDGIHLEELVGQVRVYAEQGDDVDEGGDGPAHAEEKRHPGQIEPELDRVEGGGVLGVAHALDARRERVQARRDGPVRRVAHQAVQRRPGGAED